MTARVEGLQSELDWRQNSMKAREDALEANTKRDEETNTMKLELMQVGVECVGRGEYMVRGAQ